MASKYTILHELVFWGSRSKASAVIIASFKGNFYHSVSNILLGLLLYGILVQLLVVPTQNAGLTPS